MSLLTDWREFAYSHDDRTREGQEFWIGYFNQEKAVYEQILATPEEPVSGTVTELAQKYNMELTYFVGFLDGINDSLKNPNSIEEMEADTVVSLDYDKEKLYYNMVAAKADWLYGLEQWDALLTPERRKELYKEQRSSTTVVKPPKIGRNDPCPCGSGKKYKACHLALDDKLEDMKNRGFKIPTHAMIKNAEQIEGIREASKVNTSVLDYITPFVKIGVSTRELDDLIYNYTKSIDAIPACLGYEGYPKSVCISVNDVVCHGIPSDDIILQDGDIVNIDCTTEYKGYFGDSSRMFMLGNVDPAWKKLVGDTKKALDIGVEVCSKPYVPIGDIGYAINFAQEQGYSVVREIGGHGVGLAIHEEPYVSHIGQPGKDYVLAPGMVFTIEPMINMGGPDVYQDADDGWTIYTEDGSPSAQWEYTLVMTEHGVEILAH